MIDIRYHSGIYTLMAKQELPLKIEEAWKFFSTPENLVLITPPHMEFVITSGKATKMYSGQIISYKVSPVSGIKTNWITEITQVEQGKFFVDEQRFGPYRMWHHEHHFTESEKGIIMFDKVSYKLPFGFIGRLAHLIFVRKQLESIFQFREHKLTELFG